MVILSKFNSYGGFLNMFENLIEILKANPRKIVFTEGPDARITITEVFPG